MKTDSLFGPLTVDRCLRLLVMPAFVKISAGERGWKMENGGWRMEN